MYKWLLCLLLAAPAPAVEEPPVVNDYNEALSQMADWSENIANPKRYNDLVLQVQEMDDKTKKPAVKNIKFVELPPFDQDIFYLQQMELCSNHLFHLEKMWTIELHKTKNLPEDRKKVIEEADKDKPAKQKMASTEQIEGFLAKLMTIRKSHAAQYEKEIAKTFEKHKDKLPAEERSTYTRQVRAWHDKHKLIDRKAQ